jgi:hypothetical protein
MTRTKKDVDVQALKKLNHDGSANFLESQISLIDDNTDLRIRFLPKNETSIMNSEPIILKRITPANNFNSSKIKLGTIIGTLIRIYMVSPDQIDDKYNDLVHAIQIASQEYIINGYPMNMIRTAINILKERTHDDRLNNIQITRNKL